MKDSYGSVQLHSKVTLKLGEREERYTIVESGEENIAEGKVSKASSIGKALLNHENGDFVEVKTPDEIIWFQIVAIE